MHPLSIYIHWPFCKSKCPYCDFNSHVREGVEHARWRAALLAELAHYAKLLPGRQVVSIFFGGGTPSLMEAETVAALIGAVQQNWRVANTIEITLEANPTSVEAAKLREFKDAGVNRVSLGVQALNAEALKFLGRHHSADEALAAVELARGLFDRMSFDLIYARSGQTLAAWEKELTEALKYARGHLSLYQLTIEENTAFHAAQKRGELPTLDDDTAADMYALTAGIMQAHGMPAYEISNYAASGQESAHNLTYWRGDDYVGIGPGAHGRYSLYSLSPCGRGLGRGVSVAKPEFVASPSPRPSPVKGEGEERGFFSTENIKSPERWLEQMEQNGTALQARTEITPDERKREMVMMGLRLTSGIDFADWQKRTGYDLRDVIDERSLSKLVREGFLISDDAGIRITPKGALILNTVTGKLLV